MSEVTVTIRLSVEDETKSQAETYSRDETLAELHVKADPHRAWAVYQEALARLTASEAVVKGFEVK